MKKKIQNFIRRKLKEAIGKYVPYNTKYRPVGVYETSKDFINAVANKEPDSTYIEIYPDLISTLDVTKEFHQACSQSLKPVFQVKTTYAAIAVQKGRIYTDYQSTIAIISQDNHLIGDISLNYRHRKVVKPAENEIFRQKYFKKPVQYKGVVFSMLSGQGAIINYGHWLIDAIPRIHLLKESGWFDKVDYFLVPNYTYDYHKDTLKLLGIDVSKVIAGNEQLHIQADVIIATTAPRGNKTIFPQWGCNFLRDSYLKESILLKKYPPLVYISRRDSAIRRVQNEDEVIHLLEKYGFRTYVLSDLSFVEKVQLFASASIIVSATGAGMVNTVFCKPGSKVLEIFGEGFVHHDTYDQAMKVGLDYYYLIGKEGRDARKNVWQIQHQHLIVDTHKLKQMLDRLLLQAHKENPV